MLDEGKRHRYGQAYEQIRTRILAGELRAGELISEVQLAHELAISRTPVREAVRQLIRQGLVEATPRGIKIFRPTADDVAEVYFLRAAIEGAVVRAAATKVTPAQVAELRHIHSESLDAAATGDVAALVELNSRFHWLLTVAAGSARAAATLRDLDPLVATYRRLSLTSPELRTNWADDHGRLIELLERGDGPGAEELMRSHITRAGRQIAEAVLHMEPSSGRFAQRHFTNLDSLVGRRTAPEET